MPARTNPFQELITFLERAAAPTGATVTPSAMRRDADGDAVEVDILVEHAISGHPIRIAIEARDHKRPQGKSWIYDLRERADAMGIGDAIAVSKSGFTKGGLRAAKRVGVRALTLEEALHEDWPEAIAKLDITFDVVERNLHHATLIYADGVTPPVEKGDPNGWLIQGAKGEDVETFEKTALRLYGADAERYTEEHIQANGLHEKLALGDQPFKFDIQYTADGRFAIPPDGVPRALRLLVLTISGTLRRVGSSYEHYRYEGQLVRVATPDIGDGEIGRVIMTQPGGPGSTAVYADLQLPPGKTTKSKGKNKGKSKAKAKKRKPSK